MPVVRRLLALLAALAMVAAGVFLIVEVVAAWIDRGPVLLSENATQTWRTTGWDDSVVVWTAIVMAMIGLALIVLAIWPDTPTTVPTGVDDVELERRPLEATLQRELESVDGVTAAKVRARRNITAQVQTNRTTDTGSVEQAGRDRLEQVTRRLATTGAAAVRLRARRISA